MDYWNYRAIRTEPASPLMARVFDAVYRSFADAGGSLDVAGHLPAWMGAAGFRVDRTDPVCRIARPGTPVWRWIDDFQTLYLPTLVQKGYLTAGETNDYRSWWEAVSARPESLLFAPPVLSVVGVRV
jgi:hypothetical protein